MTSYTSSLLLPQPTPFDPAVKNVWGTIENTGRTLVDQAYGGAISLSLTSGTTILTSTQGAVDQSRNRRFVLTGTLTGNVTILWPNGLNRYFSVQNNTTGAFTVTLGVDNGSGSPAGSTVVVPQAQRMDCASDGTNLFPLFIATGGNLTVNGNLSVTGTFSISSLTVSSALTVGSNTSTTTVLSINGIAGSLRQIDFDSAGVGRWIVGINNAAESSPQTGSDFFIDRLDNTGTFIDSPLVITRSNGTITAKNQLVVGLNSVNNSALGVVINGGSGTDRVIEYSTNLSPRWKVYTDASAESGANVGSNFVIQRLSDGGASIDNPFAIIRSTGAVQVGTGGFTVDSLVTIQSGGLVIQTGGANITGDVGITGGLVLTGAHNITVDAGTITSSGTITSTTGNLSIAGTGGFGGTVSAPNFNATSDERLKTDIKALRYDPDAVPFLRPVTFRFKDRPDEELMGLIAQEVEQVLPMAVRTNEEGIKHLNIMALLTAMLAELQVLRSRVVELEAQR